MIRIVSFLFLQIYDFFLNTAKQLLKFLFNTHVIANAECFAIYYLTIYYLAIYKLVFYRL